MGKRDLFRNLTFIYLLIFFLFYSATAFAEPSVEVSLSSEEVKQGDILLITAKANPGAHHISGSIFDKPVHFYRDSDREGYTALIGIDMNVEPDLYTLSLFIEGEEGGKINKDYKVKVSSANFGTQRLTLPEKMVKLDEETLKRVKFEEEKIGKVWDIFTGEHLWNGNFIVPVEGELSSDFGLRRIMNGEPKNPHTGIDIAAPEGTPVHTSNHGKIVFIDELFYTGKTLIIDHGLGLFTMYFHLSEILVKEGDDIQKGQLIAKVGKSGRATGPHLHWGIRLNGSRVNPFSLVELPL